MCGRSRCTLAPKEIATAAGTTEDKLIEMDKYTPRNNVSPGMYTPIQYIDGKSKEMVVRPMKWGLIPSYIGKDEKPNHFMRFNARSEGVTETPAYRRLVDQRRCIVHLNGFFEWKKPEKQPYYVYHPDKSMRMAGLYDTWCNTDTGEIIYTYSILTAEANATFGPIHQRFPLVLNEEESKLWVTTAPFSTVKHLLHPYDRKDIEWHAVTKQVGTITFDSEECVIKISEPKSASIASFFLKSPQPKHDPFIEAKQHENTPNDVTKADEAIKHGAVKNEELNKQSTVENQPFSTFTTAKNALECIKDEHPTDPPQVQLSPVVSKPFFSSKNSNGTQLHTIPSRKPASEKPKQEGIMAFVQKNVERNWYDVPAFKETKSPSKRRLSTPKQSSPKRAKLQKTSPNQFRITSFFG